MVSATQSQATAGQQDDGGVSQDAVIEITRDADGAWRLQPDVLHLHAVGRVVWRSTVSVEGDAAAFRVVFQSAPEQPFAEVAGAALPLRPDSDTDADADADTDTEGAPAAWRLVLRSGARHEVSARIAPGLADGLYMFSVVIGADADFPQAQVQGALDNRPLAGTPIIVVSSDPPL